MEPRLFNPFLGGEYGHWWQGVENSQDVLNFVQSLTCHATHQRLSHNDDHALLQERVQLSWTFAGRSQP